MLKCIVFCETLQWVVGGCCVGAGVLGCEGCTSAWRDGMGKVRMPYVMRLVRIVGPEAHCNCICYDGDICWGVMRVDLCIECVCR